MVRSITFSITGSVTGSITIEDSDGPSLISLISGVFTTETEAGLQITGTDVGAQWVWSGGETQEGDSFSASVEIGQTIVLQAENPATITRFTLTNGGIDASLPDFSLVPLLERFTANGNAFDGSFPTNLPASLERFLAAGSPISGALPDLSGTALTQLNLTGCNLSALDSFALPSTVTDLLLADNGFNEAEVDAILAACVAAGLVDATIALEGNAAPSAAGLADKATLEGDGCTVTVTTSEYITNGDFATSANWTTGSGWAIAAGVAAYTPGGAGTLSQNFGALVAPLTNGSNYTLTFDLTNANGGLVAAILSGGTGSQVPYNSTGTGAGRTANFTATDDRTTIAFQSVDDEPIVVDNVSITPA